MHLEYQIFLNACLEDAGWSYCLQAVRRVPVIHRVNVNSSSQLLCITAIG